MASVDESQRSSFNKYEHAHIISWCNIVYVYILYVCVFIVRWWVKEYYYTVCVMEQRNTYQRKLLYTYIVVGKRKPWRKTQKERERERDSDRNRERKSEGKKFAVQYLKGRTTDTQRRFAFKPNSHNKHWLRSRSRASVAKTSLGV